MIHFEVTKNLGFKNITISAENATIDCGLHDENECEQVARSMIDAMYDLLSHNDSAQSALSTVSEILGQ